MWVAVYGLRGKPSKSGAGCHNSETGIADSEEAGIARFQGKLRRRTIGQAPMDDRGRLLKS